MNCHATGALLCLTILIGAAPAAASDDQCVQLSDQRQTARYGTQYLLVRDQDRHFRVSFVGNQCGAISAVAKVRLHSDGETNKLCAASGRVSNRAGMCRVAAIEEIDQGTFERFTRRR